jgi:hypothetical protein
MGWRRRAHAVGLAVGVALCAAPWSKWSDRARRIELAITWRQHLNYGGGYLGWVGAGSPGNRAE